MITHASTAVDEWLRARQQHGAMLLALDFDGTLAPIAPRPEDATLPEETRGAVNAVARRPDTLVAVISGRGLEDVAARVGIPDLIYAGNHGLEIQGPGVERQHADAIAARPALRACLARLRSAVGQVPGVIIEDKGLTLSVHYRLVADAGQVDSLRAAVRAACEADAAIRITEGKKVIEIRPAVDWNKGRALTFLLSTVLDNGNAPVIFIGDDVTDEDGFLAVAERGAGVLVADPLPEDTAAQHYLSSPREVAELLQRLAS